jgi:hypothetical protein
MAPSPGTRTPEAPGRGRKRDALANGVELYPGIFAGLGDWAEKLGVEPPRPLGS